MHYRTGSNGIMIKLARRDNLAQGLLRKQCDRLKPLIVRPLVPVAFNTAGISASTYIIREEILTLLSDDRQGVTWEAEGAHE